MGCSSGYVLRIGDETIHRVSKLSQTSRKSVRFQEIDLHERDTADCSEDSRTSDKVAPVAEIIPGDLRMFLLMVDHAPAILENKVIRKRIRDFGTYEKEESSGLVRHLRSKLFP